MGFTRAPAEAPGCFDKQPGGRTDPHIRATSAGRDRPHRGCSHAGSTRTRPSRTPSALWPSWSAWAEVATHRPVLYRPETIPPRARRTPDRRAPGAETLLGATIRGGAAPAAARAGRRLHALLAARPRLLRRDRPLPPRSLATRAGARRGPLSQAGLREESLRVGGRVEARSPPRSTPTAQVALAWLGDQGDWGRAPVPGRPEHVFPRVEGAPAAADERRPLVRSRSNDWNGAARATGEHHDGADLATIGPPGSSPRASAVCTRRRHRPRRAGSVCRMDAPRHPLHRLLMPTTVPGHPGPSSPPRRLARAAFGAWVAQQYAQCPIRRAHRRPGAPRLRPSSLPVQADRWLLPWSCFRFIRNPTLHRLVSSSAWPAFFMRGLQVLWPMLFTGAGRGAPFDFLVGTFRSVSRVVAYLT